MKAFWLLFIQIEYSSLSNCYYQYIKMTFPFKYSRVGPSPIHGDNTKLTNGCQQANIYQD
jgi:hypothetical protein